MSSHTDLPPPSNPLTTFIVTDTNCSDMNLWLNILQGLHEAYDLCPTDDLKALIRAGMEKRQTEVVKPVLFECSMNGDADKIYSLLEEGDCVNPLTLGDWPVYMAVGNGHLEVLKLLHEVRKEISP